MNDATRELGAALGIAILGSIAASRYASHIAPFLHGLKPSDASASRTSIANALGVAKTLHGSAHTALVSASEHAFVSGLHVAAVVGAVLAALSSLIVYRYLPRSLTAGGAMHGAVESLEDAAELGIAGTPPVFADLAEAAEG